jgi:8-oxo-dGTP pyrophosphatase MutT (NUDIX family)
MDSNVVPGVVRREGSDRYRKLAALLQRHPWLAWLTHRLIRIVQPRFSVGTIGVLLDDTGERVLLVEHVFHAKCPWGLPGGWLNRNEDPAAGLAREFYEETGLRVKTIYPLIVDTNMPEIPGHINLVFLVQPDGGDQTIRLSYELLSYRWTPLDELPPLIPLHRQGIEIVKERR